MVQVQTDLSGKLTPKGVCCASCISAENEKCTCRCGGLFHGTGRKQKEEVNKEEENEKEED